MFEKYLEKLIKDSLEDMNVFRETVLDNFYVLVTVCLFFSLAAAFARFLVIHNELPFLLQAAGYACFLVITVFRKRIAFNFKLYAILFINLLVAYAALFSYGMQSLAVLMIMIGATFTILLLNFRAFAVFLALNILLMGSFAVLVALHLYRFGYDIAIYQYSALGWASYIVNFVLYSFLFLYIIGTLTQGYVIFFLRIRKSLAEKEVLMKEIHHRIKNNLQLVSSLLSLQAVYIKDPYDAALFDDSRSRITSIASVHEKLYRSGDPSSISLKPFIKDLVRNILEIYRKPGQSITHTVTIPDISLPVDTAVSLGLIVNEIVTNSVKYAFRNREGGRLSLILKDGQKDRLSLVISDDGEGLAGGFDIEKTETLGLRLIRLLVEQLKGEYSIKSSPGSGTDVEVIFCKSA